MEASDAARIDVQTPERNARRLDEVERAMMEVQQNYVGLARQLDDLKTSLEQIALAFEYFVRNQGPGSE